MISKTDSECQSTNTEVYDKSLFEGLTSKQKKNLRKKLQRQRKKEKKKLENSQIQSSIEHGDSVKGDLDIDNQEIDAIDIDIGDGDGTKKDEEPGKPQNILSDLADLKINDDDIEQPRP